MEVGRLDGAFGSLSVCCGVSRLPIEDWRPQIGDEERMEKSVISFRDKTSATGGQRAAGEEPERPERQQVAVNQSWGIKIAACRVG